MCGRLRARAFDIRTRLCYPRNTTETPPAPHRRGRSRYADDPRRRVSHHRKHLDSARPQTPPHPRVGAGLSARRFHNPHDAGPFRDADRSRVRSRMVRQIPHGRLVAGGILQVVRLVLFRQRSAAGASPAGGLHILLDFGDFLHILAFQLPSRWHTRRACHSLFPRHARPCRVCGYARHNRQLRRAALLCGVHTRLRGVGPHLPPLRTRAFAGMRGDRRRSRVCVFLLHAARRHPDMAGSGVPARGFPRQPVAVL